jgi:hypothetical protein
MLAKPKIILHNISNPNPQPTMSQDENDKAKRSPALYIPTEQDYSSPARALSLAILLSLALVAIITILAVSF